jgi:hypothetical protein
MVTTMQQKRQRPCCQTKSCRPRKNSTAGAERGRAYLRSEWPFLQTLVQATCRATCMASVRDSRGSRFIILSTQRTRSARAKVDGHGQRIRAVSPRPPGRFCRRDFVAGRQLQKFPWARRRPTPAPQPGLRRRRNPPRKFACNFQGRSLGPTSRYGFRKVVLTPSSSPTSICASRKWS